MRALTAEEVLVVWERGAGERPVQRALTMLVPVSAESMEELARLPVGRRDARLLALRERTFGPRLTSVSECSGCGETLELDVGVDDLRVETGAYLGDAHLIVVRLNGREGRFRLPNTLDLAAAGELSDAGAARRLLIERCTMSAIDERGTTTPTSDLADELLSAAAARMSEADPQADVQLSLTCPDCGHQWIACFDIAAFLWGELQAYARRLLLDVHELATAYAWPEASILAMSPARRQAYLDLVRA